jgi:hypothetical protein
MLHHVYVAALKDTNIWWVCVHRTIATLLGGSYLVSCHAYVSLDVVAANISCSDRVTQISADLRFPGAECDCW